jgi:hypothetical protein
MPACLYKPHHFKKQAWLALSDKPLATYIHKEKN